MRFVGADLVAKMFYKMTKGEKGTKTSMEFST